MNIVENLLVFFTHYHIRLMSLHLMFVYFLLDKIAFCCLSFDIPQCIKFFFQNYRPIELYPLQYLKKTLIDIFPPFFQFFIIVWGIFSGESLPTFFRWFLLFLLFFLFFFFLLIIVTFYIIFGLVYFLYNWSLFLFFNLSYVDWKLQKFFELDLDLPSSLGDLFIIIFFCWDDLLFCLVRGFQGIFTNRGRFIPNCGSLIKWTIFTILMKFGNLSFTLLKFRAFFNLTLFIRRRPWLLRTIITWLPFWCKTLLIIRFLINFCLFPCHSHKCPQKVILW